MRYCSTINGNTLRNLINRRLICTDLTLRVGGPRVEEVRPVGSPAASPRSFRRGLGVAAKLGRRIESVPPQRMRMNAAHCGGIHCGARRRRVRACRRPCIRMGAQQASWDGVHHWMGGCRRRRDDVCPPPPAPVESHDGRRAGAKQSLEDKADPPFLPYQLRCERAPRHTKSGPEATSVVIPRNVCLWDPQIRVRGPMFVRHARLGLNVRASHPLGAQCSCVTLTGAQCSCVTPLVRHDARTLSHTERGNVRASYPPEGHAPLLANVCAPRQHRPPARGVTHGHWASVRIAAAGETVATVAPSQRRTVASSQRRNVAPSQRHIYETFFSGLQRKKTPGGSGAD
eukprot:gene12328-biopygen9012